MEGGYTASYIAFMMQKVFLPIRDQQILPIFSRIFGSPKGLKVKLVPYSMWIIVMMLWNYLRTPFLSEPYSLMTRTFFDKPPQEGILSSYVLTSVDEALQEIIQRWSELNTPDLPERLVYDLRQFNTMLEEIIFKEK